MCFLYDDFNKNKSWNYWLNDYMLIRFCTILIKTQYFDSFSSFCSSASKLGCWQKKTEEKKTYTIEFTKIILLFLSNYEYYFFNEYIKKLIW